MTTKTELKAEIDVVVAEFNEEEETTSGGRRGRRPRSRRR